MKPRVSDKGGDGAKQSPEVAPEATVTIVDTNGLLDARIVPASGSADEEPAAVELSTLFRSTAVDMPNNVSLPVAASSDATSDASSDATSDATEVPTTWRCTACTLDNEMTAKRCKVCWTLRFPHKKKSMPLEVGTKIKFLKLNVYKDKHGLGVEYARIKFYSVINDAYKLQTLDGERLGDSDDNKRMSWWEVIEE